MNEEEINERIASEVRKQLSLEMIRASLPITGAKVIKHKCMLFNVPIGGYMMFLRGKDTYRVLDNIIIHRTIRNDPYITLYPDNDGIFLQNRRTGTLIYCNKDTDNKDVYHVVDIELPQQNER